RERYRRLADLPSGPAVRTGAADPETGPLFAPGRRFLAASGPQTAVGTPHSGPWLGSMEGWRGFRVIAVCGGFLAAWGGLAAVFAEDPRAEMTPAPSCGAEEIARGTVRTVLDGRTFVLDDGREVRLAAIEVPALASTPEAATPPQARSAAAALHALAAGD